MADPSSDNDAALVARQRAGDNAEPFSITEISTLLKRTVEDRFGFVRLRGELSGVKRAASGHLYCALKDEKAVIDGVMWRGSAQRLSFVPEDGLEVVASGKLTTYAGRSKYQVVIDSLEIAGEGALLALLEKTRARLAEEGLFDQSRKRSLPFLPRTIGVVTSPTGAVIRDILHRLADRFPSHVLVWPVLVQGQGAAQQVAQAVRGFGAMDESARPDLLIVARGGGSIEDLWSFNEEIVVRAIAESPIPTICAVGHETDTTLADHAADRRAPTPTAAAEIAVPVRAELAAGLADLGARTKRAILRPVTLGRERLMARARHLPRPDALLQPQAQKLDDLTERLRRGLADRAQDAQRTLLRVPFGPGLLRSKTERAADRLQTAGARLDPRLLRRVKADREAGLAALGRMMTSLNPDSVLARGYARILDAAGNTVTDRALAAGEPALTIKFRDGDLGVVPAGSSPAHARPRKPAKRPADTQTRQDDLFG